MATEIVYGISMIKDEIDVIDGTLLNMFNQVDHVIVADNCSTDGTAETMMSYETEGYPITVMFDNEVAYYQARKITKLADRAARMGADWVVPFDADELWQANYANVGTIRDKLQDLPAAIVEAVLYEYVPTEGNYERTNPFKSIQWHRPEPMPLRKVAVRPVLPVRIAQGNHSASYDGNIISDQLIVRHFPYRSSEQFIKKIRNGYKAYAATDLHPSLGDHWRRYGTYNDAQLVDIFLNEHYSYNPEEDGLTYSPV